MGKRKKGAIPTNAPKQKKPIRIDMTKTELAKVYQVPGFRTGKHITEKDRPRKKNWKKEYESERRGSNGYSHDDGFGSFLLSSQIIYFQQYKSHSSFAIIYRIYDCAAGNHILTQENIS